MIADETPDIPAMRPAAATPPTRAALLDGARKRAERGLAHRTPPACPMGKCAPSSPPSEFSPDSYSPSWLFRHVRPSAWDRNRKRGRTTLQAASARDPRGYEARHWDKAHVLAHCWLHGPYVVQVCVTCHDYKPPYEARSFGSEPYTEARWVCAACAPLGREVILPVKAGDWAHYGMPGLTEKLVRVTAIHEDFATCEDYGWVGLFPRQRTDRGIDFILLPVLQLRPAERPAIKEDR